ADNSGNAIGTPMARWKDLSPTGTVNNLSVVGSITLQPGDPQHNFNPWVTGFSNSNYFNGYDTALFKDYNTSGYSYSPLTIFGAARPTSAVKGLITGIDNESTNGGEPGFGIESSLYPSMYRYSNFISQTASGTSLQATLNRSSVFLYQPPYNSSHSGAGNLILGFNGNQNTVAGVSAAGSVVGPWLKIGYEGWTYGAFSGDIQEVVWYKSTLSATDINKVHSYLAIKYGVT